MQRLVIVILVCVCVSAQAFHVNGGNHNEASFKIIPFGLQDIWSKIETIEDKNLFFEFEDLLVKLMEASEEKIQHANKRILMPLKSHLENNSQKSLALIAQSVQALTVLLFSKDSNRSCICCCGNCCNNQSLGFY